MTTDNIVCYQHVMTNVTRDGAVEACSKAGGELLNIDKAHKINYVKKLPSQDAFWVWAEDINHDGTWRWKSGECEYRLSNLYIRVYVRYTFNI